MNKLMAIDNLVKGKVIKRPSASCKTPYVADVELEDGTIVLAHTTSLGLGGYRVDSVALQYSSSVATTTLAILAPSRG